LLDIGKVPVVGEARESTMAEAAEELIAEAMGVSPEMRKRAN